MIFFIRRRIEILLLIIIIITNLISILNTQVLVSKALSSLLKSNNVGAKNNENQCEIIGESCVIKDNCSFTFLNPTVCANAVTGTSCDFMLSWNVIDSNTIKFSLIKFNVQANQWVSIGFSNNELLSKVDVVLGIVYNNGSGEIYKSRVEDIEYPISLLNRDEASDKSITYNGETGMITMEFTRSMNIFNNKSDIALNNCNLNSDGVFLFIAYGVLDPNNNARIFYATKRINLGQYCFIECLLNAQSTTSFSSTTTSVYSTSLLNSRDLIISNNQSTTSSSQSSVTTNAITTTTNIPSTTSLTTLSTSLTLSTLLTTTSRLNLRCATNWFIGLDYPNKCSNCLLQIFYDGVNDAITLKLYLGTDSLGFPSIPQSSSIWILIAFSSQNYNFDDGIVAILDQNSRLVFDATVNKSTNLVVPDKLSSISSGYIASTDYYNDFEATRKRNTIQTNQDNINLRDKIDKIYLAYGVYDRNENINLNKSLAIFTTAKEILTCGILVYEDLQLYLKLRFLNESWNIAYLNNRSVEYASLEQRTATFLNSYNMTARQIVFKKISIIGVEFNTACNDNICSPERRGLPIIFAIQVATPFGPFDTTSALSDALASTQAQNNLISGIQLSQVLTTLFNETNVAQSTTVLDTQSTSSSESSPSSSGGLKNITDSNAGSTFGQTNVETTSLEKSSAQSLSDPLTTNSVTIISGTTPQLSSSTGSISTTTSALEQLTTTTTSISQNTNTVSESTSTIKIESTGSTQIIIGSTTVTLSENNPTTISGSNQASTTTSEAGSTATNSVGTTSVPSTTKFIDQSMSSTVVLLNDTTTTISGSTTVYLTNVVTNKSETTTSASSTISSSSSSTVSSSIGSTSVLTTTQALSTTANLANNTSGSLSTSEPLSTSPISSLGSTINSITPSSTTVPVSTSISMTNIVSNTSGSSAVSTTTSKTSSTSSVSDIVESTSVPSTTKSIEQPVSSTITLSNNTATTISESTTVYLTNSVTNKSESTATSTSFTSGSTVTNSISSTSVLTTTPSISTTNSLVNNTLATGSLSTTEPVSTSSTTSLGSTTNFITVSSVTTSVSTGEPVMNYSTTTTESTSAVISSTISGSTLSNSISSTSVLTTTPSISTTNSLVNNTLATGSLSTTEPVSTSSTTSLGSTTNFITVSSVTTSVSTGEPVMNYSTTTTESTSAVISSTISGSTLSNSIGSTSVLTTTPSISTTNSLVNNTLATGSLSTTEPVSTSSTTSLGSTTNFITVSSVTTSVSTGEPVMNYSTTTTESTSAVISSTISGSTLSNSIGSTSVLTTTPSISTTNSLVNNTLATGSLSTTEPVSTSSTTSLGSTTNFITVSSVTTSVSTGEPVMNYSTTTTESTSAVISSTISGSTLSNSIGSTSVLTTTPSISTTNSSVGSTNVVNTTRFAEQPISSTTNFLNSSISTSSVSSTESLLTSSVSSFSSQSSSTIEPVSQTTSVSSSTSIGAFNPSTTTTITRSSNGTTSPDSTSIGSSTTIVTTLYILNSTATINNTSTTLEATTQANTLSTLSTGYTTVISTSNLPNKTDQITDTTQSSSSYSSSSPLTTSSIFNGSSTTTQLPLSSTVSDFATVSNVSATTLSIVTTNELSFNQTTSTTTLSPNISISSELTTTKIQTSSEQVSSTQTSGSTTSIPLTNTLSSTITLLNSSTPTSSVTQEPSSSTTTIASTFPLTETPTTLLNVNATTTQTPQSTISVTTILTTSPDISTSQTPTQTQFENTTSVFTSVSSNITNIQTTPVPSDTPTNTVVSINTTINTTPFITDSSSLSTTITTPSIITQTTSTTSSTSQIFSNPTVNISEQTSSTFSTISSSITVTSNIVTTTAISVTNTILPTTTTTISTQATTQTPVSSTIATTSTITTTATATILTTSVTPTITTEKVETNTTVPTTTTISTQATTQTPTSSTTVRTTTTTTTTLTVTSSNPTTATLSTTTQYLPLYEYNVTIRFTSLTFDNNYTNFSSPAAILIKERLYSIIQNASNENSYRFINFTLQSITKGSVIPSGVVLLASQDTPDAVQPKMEASISKLKDKIPGFNFDTVSFSQIKKVEAITTTTTTSATPSGPDVTTVAVAVSLSVFGALVIVVAGLLIYFCCLKKRFDNMRNTRTPQTGPAVRGQRYAPNDDVEMQENRQSTNEARYELGDVERSVDVTEINVAPSNVTFKGLQGLRTDLRDDEEPKTYEHESIEIEIDDADLRPPTPPPIQIVNFIQQDSRKKSLSKAETDSFEEKPSPISSKSKSSISSKKQPSIQNNLYVNIDQKPDEEKEFESLKLGEFSSNIEDSNLNESYKFKTKSYYDTGSIRNQTFGDIVPQLLQERSNRSPTESIKSFKNEDSINDRITSNRLDAEIEQAISEINKTNELHSRGRYETGSVSSAGSGNNRNNFELRGNGFNLGEYDFNKTNNIYVNVPDEPNLIFENAEPPYKIELKPFDDVISGNKSGSISKYSTVNSNILETSKMKNISEDELRINYDNISYKTDPDANDSTPKTDSSRFELPSIKPVSNNIFSNILLNINQDINDEIDSSNQYANVNQFNNIQQSFLSPNPSLLTRGDQKDELDKNSISNRPLSSISDNTSYNTYNIEKNIEIRENLKEKLKEIKTRDAHSDNSTSLSSNMVPSELTENDDKNVKIPGYRLPSTDLNVPYYNPNTKLQQEEDQFARPVKFNSKDTQNNLVLAALLRSKQQNQNNDANQNSDPNQQPKTELSAESRRKIDEVKAKLEALSKKYAAGSEPILSSDKQIDRTLETSNSFTPLRTASRLSSSLDKDGNSLVDELKYGGLDLPKPRLCVVNVDPNFSGLGLHIGDAKSSSFSNSTDNRRTGNNMIRKVEPGSPAEKAGLKPGDRILEIDNENVENIEYNTLVNKLRDALKNNRIINLVVMNSVEYNVYKSNNIPILSEKLPVLTEAAQTPQTPEPELFQYAPDQSTIQRKESIESSFQSQNFNKSTSRPTSRPTTPSSAKLSLYNYQPTKTQVINDQASMQTNKWSFKGANDVEIVKEPLEKFNNKDNISRRSSIDSNSESTYSANAKKRGVSGYYDFSTGQGIIGSNLPDFETTFDFDKPNENKISNITFKYEPPLVLNKPLDPVQPLLIKPQVVKMDTFAITTFNSSEENSEDDSTSITDNYPNVGNLKTFQRK